ncbi:uncharacterized protein [Rutidosis leptorrhynchoides]|uniref:uncharacterized protein n=1 Tax=Rutidosis leptorrhynchoides TaxID=125765 RepID=UPI003A99FEED
MLSMKIISFNIRGFRVGNSIEKIGWVRNLLSKERPSFIALQETRLKQVNLSWINALCGFSNCNFVQKERVGFAGGQLIIWDTDQFDASDTIVFDCVLGVHGVWKATNSPVNFLNIHGPHDDAGKVRLWESLSKILGVEDEAWILCGDFNEVREEVDRLNCEFIEYLAKRFNDFISNNQLMEIPLGGRNFTRISDDGLKFSKIDRFLCTEKFFSLWKDVSAVTLERKISDHCPIMLKDEGKNFGPKPFKIFDAWLDEVGIEDVICKAWEIPVPNINRKDCMFRNRLKNVKNALRDWSSNRFGGLDAEIEALKLLSMNYELKAENNGLNDNERKAWIDCRKKWIDKDKVKSCMLKQKARVKWCLEGDENTSYFHSIINRNNNRNNMRGLIINGVWNESPTEIKEEVFKHFKHVFEECNGERPSMEDLSYPSLSLDDANALELPFEEK